MKNKSLEERIQRLEDIEAIKDVTARYSFNINKGWNGKEVNPHAMPSIFAKDATWESEALGIKGTGLDKIMNGLPDATKGVKFSMHNFTNPVIQIEENKASGNWLFWVAVRHKGTTPNELYMSADISYVRSEDGWLIHTYQLFYGMSLLPRE